jgi:hypothetical protein
MCISSYQPRKTYDSFSSLCEYSNLSQQEAESLQMDFASQPKTRSASASDALNMSLVIFLGRNAVHGLMSHAAQALFPPFISPGMDPRQVLVEEWPHSLVFVEHFIHLLQAPVGRLHLKEKSACRRCCANHSEDNVELPTNVI